MSKLRDFREREADLLRVQAIVPATRLSFALAMAEPLSNTQLRGYVHLLACGEHPETASLLLRHCADALVPEIAQRVGAR